MLACCLAVLLLAPAQGLAEPEPYRIGLCVAAETPSELELAFTRGAELAALLRNRRGGVFGHPLELVPVGACESPKEARALVQRLTDGELAVALAPLEHAGLGPLRTECERRGFALLAPATEPAREAETLVAALVAHLRCTRLGLLRERDPAGKELARELAARLQPPHVLALEVEARPPLRNLAARLAEASVEVLVLDLEPATLALLSDALVAVRTPLVLGWRAARAAPTLGRELLFVHGLSPAAAEPRGEFLAEFRGRHGEPGPGAAEGYELVLGVARAIEAAGSARPVAVRAALVSALLAGPRGELRLDEHGHLPVPLALWRLTDRARPHVPPALAAGETIPDGAGRTPDARVGEPFGALRTDAFRSEPGSRTVRLHFGAPGVRTIDADLARLGLSTGGASPFVDHLVREDLLARTLSLVSTKYLRAKDGRSVPGQSLRVAFVANVPPSEPGTAWQAVLAGADDSANGRAFPGDGLCHVFTTNWLSTVLAHALEPALGPADLGLLDGTYVFGSDYRKDARSELVRALIAGYASSLGLTTAHEVGHLFGLEHDSDPRSVMCGDEDEPGIAPEGVSFAEAALERLRKSPGVVK